LHRRNNLPTAKIALSAPNQLHIAGVGHSVGVNASKLVWHGKAVLGTIKMGLGIAPPLSPEWRYYHG
jgi:hypothetical protein